MAITRKDLNCPCCGQAKLDPRLFPALQLLEKSYNSDLKINSCFRCSKHNEELKARGYPVAVHSYHLLGMAVDISTVGLDREKLIGLAKMVGFTGIGRGSNYVHLDFGPCREWVYY